MRVYLSHKIRGEQGKNASNVYMKKNCDIAIEIADKIRKAIPSLEIYCPGEHEDFVSRSYKLGYLTEGQILEIDCKIIDNCDIVIIYIPKDDWLQGGRLVEFNYALLENKPAWEFNNIDKIIEKLAEYIVRQ